MILLIWEGFNTSFCWPLTFCSCNSFNIFENCCMITSLYFEVQKKYHFGTLLLFGGILVTNVSKIPRHFVSLNRSGGMQFICFTFFSISDFATSSSFFILRSVLHKVLASKNSRNRWCTYCGSRGGTEGQGYRGNCPLDSLACKCRWLLMSILLNFQLNQKHYLLHLMFLLILFLSDYLNNYHTCRRV